MPRRARNPAALERCVRAVKARGDDVNPYAVCTASLRRAGRLPQKNPTMSSPIVRVGDHIELHPGTDRWMRGDKFGTVTSVSKAGVGVKFDRSGQTKRIAPSRIGRLNGVFVDGVSIPAPRRKAKKVANPRVACGSVSSKRNKYVGATYTKRSGAAAGHRRVIGCARVGDDDGYYATRRVGAKGTRYTPVKKRALRDLKSTHKGAVKLPRHKGVKHTSASLISAWEKRYAKPARGRATR